MAKREQDARLDGYDKAFKPTMRKRGPNANYDFSRQVDPNSPMGHGEFANMPEKPIMREYSNEPQYRDGLINSFTSNIRDVSDICENER
jgi:hypothetical protein